MDAKGKIEVGVSASLIDLKSELLRKQAELTAQRFKQQQESGGGRGVAKSLSTKKEPFTKKSVHPGQNKGVAGRSARDEEQHKLEQRTLERSQEMLEQKARLYDKMVSEALDHDEAEHPVLATSLVNFTRKAIDRIKEQNEAGSSSRPRRIIEETVATSSSGESEEDESYAAVDDDEWTEFIDGLGRTRRCLKSELPSFLARDDVLARPTNPGVCLSREANEQLIENKRQQWEKETEATAAKDSVHYQDVMYDEVRTHGVGFFRFAKDETARGEQLKELKKLSAQTEATRKRVLTERLSKEASLQQQLKKIRDRKRAKLGLPPTEDPTPPVPEKVEKEDENPTPSTIQEESSTTKPEEEKPIKAWDVGKPGVFGPKPVTFDELDAKWLKERREDRLSEFAPPSFYK